MPVILPSSLLAVAFGGGTNSTAMLCGFRERGIKPDLILFADTGGELPETYEHVMEMDIQCRIWWGVGIGTVRTMYQGGFEGLAPMPARKRYEYTLDSNAGSGCSSHDLFCFLSTLRTKRRPSMDPMRRMRPQAACRSSILGDPDRSRNMDTSRNVAR